MHWAAPGVVIPDQRFIIDNNKKIEEEKEIKN